jgi:hypothetical protein
VSESHEARIAREEEYWTAPRLIVFGGTILTVAIGIIWVLAHLREWTS